MQKRGINIDSLALIFSFILFAQLLSYVVPQGTFDRVPYPDNPNRSMVVAGTYETVSAEEEVSLPPWYFLEGVTKGLALLFSSCSCSGSCFLCGAHQTTTGSSWN